MFYNKAKIFGGDKCNRNILGNNTYKSILRTNILVCLVLSSEIWWKLGVYNANTAINR